MADVGDEPRAVTSRQTTARYIHLGAGVQAAAVRLFDLTTNGNAPRGTDVSRLDSEK